jgi:hypothetical protein
MAFSDLVAALDNTCLSTFSIPAMWQPQTGGAPVAISGIVKPLPLLEEMQAGSAAGVTNVYFFIHMMPPSPQRGDTLTLNTVNYNVQDVLTDSEAGTTLKLKRNA